jgi:hypothetical protein
VYVYRDTSGQPGEHATASAEPAENDAAYWYDLSRTGDRTGAPPHAIQEARGPFEPLVSSADPPGAPRSVASDDPGAADATAPDGARPDDTSGEAKDDSESAHARKLEQIKDLYLTAEAIGEANVDKHFDQLLAQQRELIGEYFRQSGAARPAGRGDQAAEGGHAAEGGQADPGYPAPWSASPDQADTDPGIPRHPGPSAPGPAAAAESARVTADHPRAW